jgi:two-component system NarL family sensor kinase
LQLETADALLEGARHPVQLSSAVRRALELTRGTLEEARRSVLELRAAPLDGRTLAEALGSLLRELEGGVSGAPAVRVSMEGDVRTLPRDVEIGFYRIAREALSNVLRHARARAAAVELSVSPEAARLRVSDDGVGFSPHQVPRGRFGLIGMNERAKLLGGTLQVHSDVGRGTTIEVDVPLRATE